MIEIGLECVCYISASPRRNGLLHALLKSPTGNCSFVQEMDENGRVTDFIEFTDFDHFYTVTATKRARVDVGSDGLVAYFDEKGHLVEIATGELRLKTLSDEIRLYDLPVLTQIHINRIVSPKRLYSGELFEMFAWENQLGATALKVLRAANVKNIQESSGNWAKIRAIPEHLFSDEQESSGILELEDLIRDLFFRYIDSKWVDNYLYVLKKVIFDERILELGIRLLNDDAWDIFSFPEVSAKILPRLFDLASYMKNSTVAADFWDALVDPFSTGRICEAIDSHNIELISVAINEMAESQTIRRDAIDVYLEKLEDEFISSPLANTLVDYIINTGKLDTRNYEFDQKNLSLREVIRGYTLMNPRLQLVLQESLASQFR